MPKSGNELKNGLEHAVVTKWIAISLLLIVLAFTVEQAPEFGKPFTVLILVAGILRYSKAIGITFNQTQGSTK
jgi:NhaP-type Na+/H+ and K+/H+ antiporter